MLLTQGACGGPPSSKGDTAALSPATHALIVRAKEREKERRYDVAETLYTQAIAQARGATSKHFACSEFAAARAFWGQLERAAALYRCATEARPDIAASWQNLGILAASLGREVEALRSLLMARKLAPGDYRPKIALAALYLRHQRYAEALAIYRKLREMDLPTSLRQAVLKAIAMLSKQAADNGPETRSKL